MTIESIGESSQTPFIDSLIEACQPLQKTVRVSIRGIPLTFRICTDMEELATIQVGADAFAKMASNHVSLESLKDLTPCDERTSKLAFVLAELSVEPKLSHAEALRFARRAGTVFLQIVSTIDQVSQIDFQVEEVGGIELSKNESSETPSSEAA